MWLYSHYIQKRTSAITRHEIIINTNKQNMTMDKRGDKNPRSEVIYRTISFVPVQANLIK